MKIKEIKKKLYDAFTTGINEIERLNTQEMATLFEACDEAEKDKNINRELIPCPFCGGEAEVRQRACETACLTPICEYQGECDKCYYIVHCTKCPANLGSKFCTREAAIEAWNKRAGRTYIVDIPIAD